MFSFLQSAATKLATHTSRSAVAPAKSGFFIKRSYDPKIPRDLVGRPCVIESRDQTLLANVRSLGRRVFGKAKKLLTKRTQTLSVSPSDESFCSPGNLDDDETETPFSPIRSRLAVRSSRNACTGVPCNVRGVADAEDLYGPGYEEDRSLSMLSDNSDDLYTNDSHQYQDLSDILEEMESQLEPDETEYSTILVVDENGDVAEIIEGATSSVSETGDGTVGIEIQAEDDFDTPGDFERDPSDNWTTPFPVSPFFCSPTTESTLAPPTPTESESGPSTPRYMPVLVYESASYEDALFTEFKAIIDWKEANESVV